MCVVCDDIARRDGRCPFRSKACLGASSWCPHARRCFTCEWHSCARCALHSGDGADVAGLVEDDLDRVDGVFLDFDRTVASTRRGQPPVVGTHAVDEDLARLARRRGDVSIVTRNRHVDEIAAFLSASDFPVRAVIRVPRGESKARAVLGALAADDGDDKTVVFVDDDIREHLDPAFLDENHPGVILWRVLFARSDYRGAR